MNKAILLPFILLALGGKAQEKSNIVMFRSNALHSPPMSGQPDLVFDTKEWKFFSSAPIRSTPLVTGNHVYFGNTNGEFFSVDISSSRQIWKFSAGHAINSSPALQNGILFFSDNAQTVFALRQTDGHLVWKFRLAKKEDYPWRFDYFYSSPTLVGNSLIIGGDDGYLYKLNQGDGKLIWKHKAGSIIRSSPSVLGTWVFVGDMDGRLHALDLATGKEKWSFKTVGDSLKNEEFGFDRKGILSSPVIVDDKIIFGCRDGFLYCVSTEGNLIWKMDHHVSWVISTVAVKDSFVITGTSDGHFVQAVNLNSGNEIWKCQMATLFWSSPSIVGERVYIGGFDGNEYCLDLRSGKRISLFQTGGIILSSCVYEGHHVYFGSDDGYLYCLNGHVDSRIEAPIKKFVYYEDGVKIYFRNGSDLKIKTYMENCGYKVLVSDSMKSLFEQDDVEHTVVVMATDYFPKSVRENGMNSLLRRFLDHGGRIVLAGLNPLVYEIDEKEKLAVGFNIPAADSILSIRYGDNDTRGFGGQFPCFATKEGLRYNLPDFWTAILQVKASQVNHILGENENGLVSAFIKNYERGGEWVQIWMNPDAPEHLDAIVKLSEWKIN